MEILRQNQIARGGVLGQITRPGLRLALLLESDCTKKAVTMTPLATNEVIAKSFTRIAVLPYPCLAPPAGRQTIVREMEDNRAEVRQRHAACCDFFEFCGIGREPNRERCEPLPCI